MNFVARTFFAVLILAVYSAVYGYGVPKAKKLIHFGWSKPYNYDELLKTDLQELEANCPFDGIGICPMMELKRGDKTIEYDIRQPHDNPPMLTKDDVREYIPALRRLLTTCLKHNFIQLNISIFQTDWFDDEGWKCTLNNSAMMAYLARESGFEGLCLDLEGYLSTGQPFMYRKSHGRTFEETAAQVRKRGREWIQELNRQFPNLTLFTFIWSSYKCDTPDRAAHPEMKNDSRDGLLVAFFNGVYDGAPETMKIVDGQESPGYAATLDTDFDRIAANYYRFGDAWIDPVNRVKYRTITSMGMSLYLDTYRKSKKVTPWDHHNANYPNLTALLAHNVMNTLSYADEYAWLWCERGTFWPNAEYNKYRKGVRKPFAFWGDLIPDCVEAIRFGKAWAQGIPPTKGGKNIVRNGSLEPGDSGIKPGPDQATSGIAEWSCWQDSKMPRGTIAPKDGMAHFVNVTHGSIAQTFRKPSIGQHYLFTARCKNESAVSQPRLGYFFRNSKGQGLWDIQCSLPFQKKEADGWMRCIILITVPDGRDITELTITVGVNGTQDPTGKDQGVFFDDVELLAFEHLFAGKPGDGK